ncbi:RNA exonuclease 4-like [Pecten maximus]|uniref:RNA exonuclease 4-like n=1 Tax=Pecten maximus TaxID=6579 RepID=UPI001458EDC3|nr:RNA exonuclease 4-like [Pecten maximus]XP_033745454.1 RNA exonuclease 4-like [Pecten maximus]XP_033745455.1 RNA exonuclease 4-like [Pecten maximus]
MENNKKMKRKREGAHEVHRKRQCVDETIKTKRLKEINRTKNNSKSNPTKVHVEDNSMTQTKKIPKKYRNKSFFKKKRNMSTVKSEVTEKDCITQETDKNNSSVRLKTDKKRDVHIPNQPEDFSSNWEKLKQILSPANPKKQVRKKKVEKIEPEIQPDIWFDDVDESLLDVPIKEKEKKKQGVDSLVKDGVCTGLTKALALDCEFVGVGNNSRENMLARISVVNHFGHCIYDTFVKPQEEVGDYRTWVSGVREEDMLKGVEFSEVCQKLAKMIKGRILVGHAINNDLKVLYLSPPRKLIRDTSKYKPFRKMFDGRTPSLKKLTEKVLNVTIQEGAHSSIQDAQATMRLYTMYKQKWEKELALKYKKKLKQSGESKVTDSKK